MKITNQTALIGENYAAEYLLKKGYKIIERNYRKSYGEIDIIAVKDNVLVFVEVKTRKSLQYGSGLEAIAYWKIKELLKTAQYYALSHPEMPKSLRIDAIAIYLNYDNKVSTIEHVENITG